MELTLDNFCGDNSSVECSTYQLKESGSIPTSPLQFRLVETTFADISDIFKKYHYKANHMGGGISFCFALEFENKFWGGAVIGKPRHDKAHNEGGTVNVLDIRRLACLEEAPKNTESYFLGKIIWWLKNNTDCQRVITFADQTVGHKGTIYKASNFKLKGFTAPTTHVFWNGERYHPRSLSIDRPYSYKLREAVKTGEAKVEKGLPKSIWTYDITRNPLHKIRNIQSVVGKIKHKCQEETTRSVFE
jgi:hypothetical protein